MHLGCGGVIEHTWSVCDVEDDWFFINILSLTKLCIMNKREVQQI